MAKRTARESVITARLKVQRAAARKVRNWAFGAELNFPGDPGRLVEMDDTVTADARVVQYGTDPDSKVIIGSYSGVTQTAILMPGGMHRPEWVSAVHAFHSPDGWTFAEGALRSKGPIVIGSDVLVGYEALISSGVHIGHGAIVASRAVVIKDVEPYTIVGGNPAKVIKKRFDDETIAALLRIAWWDWPYEKVAALRHEIDSPDVAGFVARHDPQRQ